MYAASVYTGRDGERKVACNFENGRMCKRKRRIIGRKLIQYVVLVIFFSMLFCIKENFYRYFFLRVFC